MPATPELKTKLDEYIAAEQETESAHTEYIADTAAEAAAILKTSASREAWLAKLNRQHVLEDEFEALVIEHEPPALPT